MPLGGYRGAEIVSVGYSFTGHLITQLPKVGTGKSPTSNILFINADTRNYAT